MELHLEKTLGILKEDVNGRRYNIWLGISLGNKSFTPEVIYEYVKWGLQHTREKVVVLLVDTIHQSNYKILSSKSAGEAAKLVRKEVSSLKIGVEKEFTKQGIQNVAVLGWDDVVDTDEYQNNLKEIKTEFKTNKDFRNDVFDLVKQARKDKIGKINSLSSKEIDELVSYPLSELALFVNPIRYQDTSYEVSPYPVFTRLDEIIVGVNEGTAYEDLAARLNIVGKVGLAIVPMDNDYNGSSS